jgi:hypothetical protein
VERRADEDGVERRADEDGVERLAKSFVVWDRARRRSQLTGWRTTAAGRHVFWTKLAEHDN